MEQSGWIVVTAEEFRLLKGNSGTATSVIDS